MASDLPNVFKDFGSFDCRLLEMTPALRNLLKRTWPLSSDEVDLMDKERADLEKRYSYIQDLISFLKDELDDVKDALSWRDSVFAPVRTLPSEILSEIFDIAASDPGNLTSPFRIDAFPRAASRVCSRWREVALSTPSLWSHIDIDANTVPYGYDGQGRYERISANVLTALSTWSERAGNSGIYLQFQSMANVVRDTNAIGELYAKAIHTLSPNLKLLGFDHVNCVYPKLGSLFLPRLETFWLLGRWTGRNLDFNAPSLTALWLHGGSSQPPVLFNNTNFPWAQLHSLSLTLDSRNIKLQLQALRCASATLEELELDQMDRILVPSEFLAKQFTFPKLGKLRLRQFANGDVLDLFVMPCMWKLSLWRWIPSTWDHLFNLLTRSRCITKLTSMELNIITQSSVAAHQIAHYLVQLFLGTTNIQRLHVSVDNPTDEMPALAILKLLSGIPDDGQALLPQMTQLDFHSANMEKLSTALQQMVETRINETKHGSQYFPITKICIGPRDSLTENIIAAMQKWEETGMQILRYYNERNPQ